jgi:hypothetical protein
MDFMNSMDETSLARVFRSDLPKYEKIVEAARSQSTYTSPAGNYVLMKRRTIFWAALKTMRRNLSSIDITNIL